MTLIVAAKCADGLLMAADSQATETAGGVAMKLPADKILPLTSRVIWGASGQSATTQDVEEALAEWLSTQRGGEAGVAAMPIAKLKSELVRVVSPVLKAAYQSYVPVPQTMPAPPVLDVLFCGVTGPGDGYAWILEISRNGAGTRYDGLGFHAIGSGSDMARLAHGTLLHYDLKNRPLAHGQVVVYRMMDTVISAIETVGPPIRMWVQDAKAFRLLTDIEGAALQASVGAWKQIERDSLLEVLQGTQTESSPPIQPDVAGLLEQAADGSSSGA